MKREEGLCLLSADCKITRIKFIQIWFSILWGKILIILKELMGFDSLLLRTRKATTEFKFGSTLMTLT
jgi:hypothetical protein